jgi:predicted nucleic acid-binding Zn ribbon protein
VGIVFKGSGFYVTDNRNGSGIGYSNGKPKKSDEKATETRKSSDTKADSSTREKSSTSSDDTRK